MKNPPTRRIAISIAVLIAAGALIWIARAGHVAGESTAAAQAAAAELTAGQPSADPAPSPHVVASSPEQAGRYLILSAGCNDCHTPGWMELGSVVPEKLWLTGVPIGWRGPWGTTYASNLRLAIKPFNEDQFIQMTRKRGARPPMPWTSLHAMSDQDLRSIYRYIKSLGPAGAPMPDFVPPDRQPRGPYLSMVPQNLPKPAQSGDGSARPR